MMEPNDLWEVHMVHIFLFAAVVYIENSHTIHNKSIIEIQCFNMYTGIKTCMKPVELNFINSTHILLHSEQRFIKSNM
jgi:hypothetical protein